MSITSISFDFYIMNIHMLTQIENHAIVKTVAAKYEDEAPLSPRAQYLVSRRERKPEGPYMPGMNRMPTFVHPLMNPPAIVQPAAPVVNMLPEKSDINMMPEVSASHKKAMNACDSLVAALLTQTRQALEERNLLMLQLAKADEVCDLLDRKLKAAREAAHILLHL